VWFLCKPLLPTSSAYKASFYLFLLLIWPFDREAKKKLSLSTESLLLSLLGLPKSFAGWYCSDPSACHPVNRHTDAPGVKPRQRLSFLFSPFYSHVLRLLIYLSRPPSQNKPPQVPHGKRGYGLHLYPSHQRGRFFPTIITRWCVPPYAWKCCCTPFIIARKRVSFFSFPHQIAVLSSFPYICPAFTAHYFNITNWFVLSFLPVGFI